MSQLIGFLVLFLHQTSSQTFHTYDCDTDTNCNTQIISPNSGGTGIHTFNCRNSGDCNNLILYHGDKGSLIINCWAFDSCSNMQIYVGEFDPPGSTYGASDMNGDGISATVYCSASDTCQNVYLSCKGEGVNLCSLFAEAETNPIQSSTVECNIGSGTCEFDCENGCFGNNNLLCHTGSSCVCPWSCNDVTQTNDVTYGPTLFPTVTPTKSPLLPGHTHAPSKTVTVNPTQSPTDYEFCTDNNDNINAGFVTLDDGWSEVICEFCVCRDNTVSELICDIIDFNNLKEYDAYLIDRFMKKCGLDQECSFKQVGLKRPSTEITVCDCDLFQCDPRRSGVNALTFTVLTILQAIVVMFL